jgi:hypothetical protein
MMANGLGYSLKPEVKYILECIAPHTNERRDTTYEGPALLPLPSQEVIDSLFSTLPSVDVNQYHRINF